MSDKLLEKTATTTEEKVTNNDTEAMNEQNIKDVTDKTSSSSTAIQDENKNSDSNDISRHKFITPDIIKKATNFKYFKAIAITLPLLIIVTVVTVTIVNATSVVNVDNTGIITTATEAPTAEPVPATDETLNFAKEKYTVKVGEKVKVSYKYTPPTDKFKSPEPYITYSSNNIEIATVDSKGNVKGVSTGTTSIVAVSDTGIYTTVPVTVTTPKSHIIEDIELITQGDEYPSGCESVSATMLLNFYKYDITPNEFIDDYLPTADFDFDEDGNMTGPDSYSAFLGTPYSEDALGCFPPAIEYAINNYLKNESYRAVDVTGSSMDSLINNYIANNQPVLIWATMWLREPVVTYEWIVKDSASYSPYNDGDTYEWLANEHCMLLIGYDEDYYYLNDPLNYSVTPYEKSIFEERYNQMGKCALVLDKIK